MINSLYRIHVKLQTQYVTNNTDKPVEKLETLANSLESHSIYFEAFPYQFEALAYIFEAIAYIFEE